MGILIFFAYIFIALIIGGYLNRSKSNTFTHPDECFLAAIFWPIFLFVYISIHLGIWIYTKTHKEN